ncbi:MAG: thiamine diphosphokinase, partial [Clostridiales bacterium]|nr:thiamine diphosphokinase [Clostridiales bacterium]
ISVFCPDGTATGVSIDGLKYPLRGATLTNLSPLGVSNQAMGKKALISVKTGTLMIFIMDGEI